MSQYVPRAQAGHHVEPQHGLRPRRAASSRSAQKEFPQILRASRTSSTIPEAIWTSQIQRRSEALNSARIGAGDWPPSASPTSGRRPFLGQATGKPVRTPLSGRAAVTAPICDRIKADGHERPFAAKTGPCRRRLLFGHQGQWTCSDTFPALRARAERGELLFGTVDSLADLEAHRRQAARHRRQQRQPHAAATTSTAGDGTTSC